MPVAPPPGMLDRILLVLGAFDADHLDRSQREIVRLTGIPQSSVQRIVTDLAAAGLLERFGRDRYVLGARMWELGELSPLALRLRETAMPHLMRLYEDSGESIHLGVLVGESPTTAEVLYITRVAGPRSVPTISHAGGRHALHATGVGKALLAQQPPAWLADYLAAPLVHETTRTITDPDELRRDLDATRERGYSLTSGEMSLDSWSIGMALPKVEGLPPIGLSIASHHSRRDVPRSSRMLRQASAAIAAELSRS